MRHRREMGANSEQHQTDVEVTLHEHRNEIELNFVEVFALSFFPSVGEKVRASVL